jgi:hypothetical protein
MYHIIFVSVLALILGILYGWAFKHLPHERWQILGTIPIRKQQDGQWQGLNLTYYGLFNACSVTFGFLMTFILLAAAGLPLKSIAYTVCGILLLCAPCAKWVAYLVERKKHTFTIGGAAFCGLVGAPLLLMVLPVLVPWLASDSLPVAPTIAALAIGYALGEGSGRLACLSFGCCYGKPIDAMPSLLQRLAAPFSIVFHGETKKVAYAGGLNGRPILAIQAITAVLYTAAGLIGILLFLQGYQRSAYLICTVVTQTWRILSEFVRADYRGNDRISIYQYLAGIAVCAAIIYSIFLPAESISVDLLRGLRILWDPVVIGISQVMWAAIFLYMGRSKITAARISLFINSDRI